MKAKHASGRPAPASAFAALVTTACLLLFPTQPVWAVDFLVGIAAKGGLSDISDKDVPKDSSPDVGFGGGGHVFAMIRLVPWFALGINMDVLAHTHTLPRTDKDENGHLLVTPSVGIQMRFAILEEGLHVGLLANYAFASGETLTNGDVNDFSMSGLLVGAQACYRLRFEPHRIYLELGAYLNYAYLELDEVAGQPVERDPHPSHVLDFGLQLAVAFEFDAFATTSASSSP